MLLPSAFLPNCLSQLGQGAIIPVIPAFAHQLGAGLGFSALVLAVLSVGQLIGTLPAGKLVEAIGERSSMLTGAIFSGVGGLLCTLAPHKLVLALGVFLIGMAAAVFGLARHTYLTVAVPVSHRARALTIAAGFARVGLLLGPFCSVAVLHAVGDVRAAFGIVVACAVCLAGLTLAFSVDEAVDERQTTEPQPGLLSTATTHRRVLTTLGVAAALINMVRQGRLVIVPLWGTALGLSESDTALIVGLSSVLDVVLFYAGGQIMDRFGRLWVVMPTLGAFVVGYAVLACLQVLPDAEVWLVVTASAMAAMNGLSSGIIATMGSDLAPTVNTATFLSVWRATADTGVALAPVVVATATALASLSTATAAMGVFAALGIGVLTRHSPLLPHARGRVPKSAA
jgi:MFS family permease